MLKFGDRKTAAVIFIFITVLIDMLGFGIVMPVMPQLILDLNGGNAEQAADWNGWLGTGWALMQFFWSPILGALSDRYGRRPVILISNFGMAIDYVFIALAPSLWWLFAARLISGAVSASVSTANAYIADVTPPDQRAKAFGLIGAAFGIGFVIGPAMGGWLGDYDPRLPFWVAGALALLNGCYGYFVLPESLPPSNRTPFSWAKANPIGSLQFLLERPKLFGFAALNFTSNLAHTVLPSVFILYALLRYNWGSKDAGLVMGFVGLCSIVVQGFLVGRAVQWLGERRAPPVAYAFGTLGFLTFAWAPSGHWLYVGIPLMSLWGLAGPAIQAQMTRQVDDNLQGKLQGMNSGVVALSGLIGPMLYSQALKIGETSNAMPGLMGLPFYIAAGLLLLCAAMAVLLARRDARAVTL
jgi:MFS transporter, DHA1 family, tetracycline resistance protein